MIPRPCLRDVDLSVGGNEEEVGIHVLFYNGNQTQFGDIEIKRSIEKFHLHRYREAI